MIKIAAMVGAPDLAEETLAAFSGPDLGAAFERMAALGYDGVELMTREPSALDGRQIRRQLDGLGLELVGLCTGHVYGEDGLGLVMPDPDLSRRAMDRMKSFVDFASEHFEEGTLVNIGRARGMGYPGERQRTLDAMVKAFRELADHARPRGVRLVLEPVNARQTAYIHTTQEGIEIARRVDRPNFGLMLDVYHMKIEDADIFESFRQVADIPRSAGPLCWFVHLAEEDRRWPGSGGIDFGAVVDVLGEIGYEGYVSFEILPWPDPEAAARSAIESLRRYIPEGDHAGPPPHAP